MHQFQITLTTEQVRSLMYDGAEIAITLAGRACLLRRSEERTTDGKPAPDARRPFGPSITT